MIEPLTDTDRLQSAIEMGADLIGENRALKAEVRRLRHALRKYGRHLGDCVGDVADPCDCGLDNALKGAP